MISNVAGWTDIEAWDCEDEQLLAAARAHLDQLGIERLPAASPKSETHLPIS